MATEMFLCLASIYKLTKCPGGKEEKKEKRRKKKTSWPKLKVLWKFMFFQSLFPLYHPSFTSRATPCSARAGSSGISHLLPWSLLRKEKKGRKRKKGEKGEGEREEGEKGKRERKYERGESSPIFPEQSDLYPKGDNSSVPEAG